MATPAASSKWRPDLFLDFIPQFELPPGVSPSELYPDALTHLGWVASISTREEFQVHLAWREAERIRLRETQTRPPARLEACRPRNVIQRNGMLTPRSDSPANNGDDDEEHLILLHQAAYEEAERQRQHEDDLWFEEILAQGIEPRKRGPVPQFLTNMTDEPTGMANLANDEACMQDDQAAWFAYLRNKRECEIADAAQNEQGHTHPWEIPFSYPPFNYAPNAVPMQKPFGPGKKRDNRRKKQKSGRNFGANNKGKFNNDWSNAGLAWSGSGYYDGAWEWANQNFAGYGFVCCPHCSEWFMPGQGCAMNGSGYFQNGGYW